MKQYLVSYSYNIMDGACMHHYLPSAITIMAEGDAEAKVLADRVYDTFLVEDNGYWIVRRSNIRDLQLLNLTDDCKVERRFPSERPTKRR